jgi:Hemolysins and related proteins containing CBS domains
MIQFAVVLVCLALNAIFSAIEMAFVSVNRVELRKLADKGDRRASTILMLRLSPERTLSVLQIGITLVGAISAAVGGAGAEESLSPFFEATFGVRENIAEAISIAVVVVPLTVASVVIGELVPKSLALKNSRKIALLSSRALYLFDTMLSPIVNLLEGMTHFIVGIFQRKTKQGRAEVTPEETSISIDSLSSTHKQFVLNLVNIESKKAVDMVVAWEKVTKVDISLTSAEVLQVAVSSGHTRMPVTSGNKVLGLLHAKEFITLVGAGDTNWQAIIRPILQVQENDDALKALKLMQEKRSHMALVCDKENVDGIITLEDVLEEIIGEIADEDDDGLMKRLLVSKSRRPLRKR